jgi:CBS domain-containing protein
VQRDESADQSKTEAKMQINEAMSSDVQVMNPDQPIRDAARMMAQIDAGFLPVGENDRLVGIITDRDIAVRAVAAGLSPDTPIRQIMTKEVQYCFAEDDIDAVADTMAEIKIRRMPVLNADKRLIGVVSIGDIAVADGPDNAGAALCGISEPGGMHSQTGNGAQAGA